MDSIDFRYAPSFWQSTICFPDDTYKTLIGKNGEFLFHHPGIGAELDAFQIVVSLTLKNAGEGKFIEQKLESPSVPIITTNTAYVGLILQQTSFATRNEVEGRVDNLLVEIWADEEDETECFPYLTIKSKERFICENIRHSNSQKNELGIIRYNDNTQLLFLLTDSPLQEETVSNIQHFNFKSGIARKIKPFRIVLRFPQEEQSTKQIIDGLLQPVNLLEDTRNFWKKWHPTTGKVSWQLADKNHEFMIASSRNISQTSEIKSGKKIFQVGPTVYRGSWIVDGNFILEAVKYLGFDKEAQEGLESIWNLQRNNGGIFAGAGEAHWKDTAIALYALSRQAELSQDWSYFKAAWQNVIRAVDFLKNIRNEALGDGTANGKYGLLPCGYGDSGIGGIRSEFTNTLWTLIGLRVIIDTAVRISILDVKEIQNFYRELYSAFISAARQEMRKHPKGFSFLPMLMKDDPKWLELDKLKHPRYQAAQVYMSHAIYPGLLFDKCDPIVKGHIELMQSVTKEDIPCETGWLAHNAVWTYNAPIFAQVYLWIGMKELARITFTGFLNHASPLYCWREEQTLRGVNPEKYIGDMPHNWASTECVRFLRHIMILEDNDTLRLFDGIVEDDLKPMKSLSAINSPTRWGRVSAELEPLDNFTWRGKFKREDFQENLMPSLKLISIPKTLGLEYQFSPIERIEYSVSDNQISIPSSFKNWEVIWKKS